ncbi:unnamed protein product [Allacma fusca]|uniref:Uncharacterized protein n=1 Tax=Allacma fusca TaxID=39272 RepID=A0A8J2PNU4_9HEXA|nr:unnamed protein product [Allacma fusca]
MLPKRFYALVILMMVFNSVVSEPPGGKVGLEPGAKNDNRACLLIGMTCYSHSNCCSGRCDYVPGQMFPICLNRC